MTFKWLLLLVTERSDDFEDLAEGWKFATIGLFVAFQRLHELDLIRRIIPLAGRRINLFTLGRFMVSTIRRGFEHS